MTVKNTVLYHPVLNRVATFSTRQILRFMEVGWVFPPAGMPDHQTPNGGATESEEDNNMTVTMRRTYERYVKVRYAKTINDIDNPTLSEWEAATNLSPFLPKDGVTPPNQQNMVDNSTIEEVFDAQAVGSYGGPLSLTLYADENALNDPTTLFEWDERGFILISWFGEPEGGDRIDVYPVASHKPVRNATAPNEMQKVSIQFAVTQEPATDVELVGAGGS